MSRPSIWFLVPLLGLPALLRVVEHPWNVAPMGALALFCGAHVRDRRLALVLPIVSAILGDVALGYVRGNFTFYTFHALLPFVYACWLASAGLGMAVRRTWMAIDSHPRDGGHSGALARGALKAVPLAAATLSGSILFFLVTNFAVWHAYPTYPHTMAGLIVCYEMALPFFRNTLESDFLFVGILFGGYAVVRRLTEPGGASAVEPRW